MKWGVRSARSVSGPKAIMYGLTSDLNRFCSLGIKSRQAVVKRQNIPGTMYDLTRKSRKRCQYNLLSSSTYRRYSQRFNESQNSLKEVGRTGGGRGEDLLLWEGKGFGNGIGSSLSKAQVQLSRITVFSLNTVRNGLPAEN